MPRQVKFCTCSWEEAIGCLIVFWFYQIELTWNYRLKQLFFTQIVFVRLSSQMQCEGRKIIFSCIFYQLWSISVVTSGLYCKKMRFDSFYTAKNIVILPNFLVWNAFPKNFHTRKLGEIMVFLQSYCVFALIWNLWNLKMSVTLSLLCYNVINSISPFHFYLINALILLWGLAINP